MSENSDTISTNVAIVRAESTAKALLNGFDHLGGISKFIQKNDVVFIKISFKHPFGFPTNINYDTLGKLIELCRDSGAKKVYVGDYPSEQINSERLTEITGFYSFLEASGALYVHLDNEELFPQRNISIDGKEIKITELILEVDKFIVLNQINVHPIFICTLSYLNLSTSVPIEYQKIQKNERPGKDYLYLDQYKQDLISNILSISAIRAPNIVINDLFYIMEGAGPFIYKDSKCKQTSLLIMGESAFTVDYITLKLMNIDLSESKLLLEAQDHQFGIVNTESIKVLGESISDTQFKIQRCVPTLEEINVKNCFLRTGRYCSGCYEKAYYLLNFLKSSMTKDLKYMGYFSFLVGEAPPKPDIKKNIIIFGDCAIESTTERDFRKVAVQRQQKITKKIINKLKKTKEKPSQPHKTKLVDNKRILELPGCPPNLIQCYDLLIKYYGKVTVPNLTLIEKINASIIDNKRE